MSYWISIDKITSYFKVYKAISAEVCPDSHIRNVWGEATDTFLDFLWLKASSISWTKSVNTIKWTHQHHMIHDTHSIQSVLLSNAIFRIKANMLADPWMCVVVDMTLVCPLSYHFSSECLILLRVWAAGLPKNSLHSIKTKMAANTHISGC